MIVPVLPPAWKAPSPHRDGSVAGFENQGTVIESSEGGAEFDQTVSQASHWPLGFQDEYTSPTRLGSAPNPVLVDNYNPLDRFDRWTSDFQDASWMAAFQDFTGNSSGDENSD
jgi:hypothetical protein